MKHNNHNTTLNLFLKIKILFFSKRNVEGAYLNLFLQFT